VNKQIELHLGTEIPGILADKLAMIPSVQVMSGGSPSYARLGDQQWPILIVGEHGLAGDPQKAAEAIIREARAMGKHFVPLVVAPMLPQLIRQALEEHDVSYADARGIFHFTVPPGVFIHYSGQSKNQRRTEAIGIGATSVRAVQTLLAFPERHWTVTDLSRAAGISLGQTHKLLGLLRQEKLTSATGPERRQRQHVQSPGALLDWLTVQPAATRAREHLPCAIFARTPGDLASKVSKILNEESIRHAWTGAAGAAFLGTGLTSVLQSRLRIEPDRSLHQVCQAISAEPVERGANLILVRDTGEVGVHGCIEHEGLLIAPLVRVFLDLLGDRRGKDAADVFREVALGY